jgi:hypothetical protein
MTAIGQRTQLPQVDRVRSHLGIASGSVEELRAEITANTLELKRKIEGVLREQVPGA